MTTKSHGGNWDVLDVLAYKGYSGAALTGVRVLKSVWIEEAGEHRYIVQNGDIKNNAWTPSSGGKSLAILRTEDLNNCFDLKWTKDALAPVKGDVLVGDDRNGKEVVLLFEADYLVHRLTPMNDSSRYQSSASLDYYKDRLTNIRVLKDTSGGRKFSSIW